MRFSNIKFLQYILVAAATAVLPSTTLASHFEFCWLTGTVESVGKTTEDTQYFKFRVDSSLPARMEVWESYDTDDCEQYSGTVIEANLPLSFQILEDRELKMIQRLWIDVNGQWWNSWHSTDGWEIDDQSGRLLDDLNDR
ncbi:MAG: hypothetical protein GY924_18125 [Planctomycetaceae bacterium]|nr:hypothetical protein [Planctomycetaceae bacterium]